MVQHLGLKYVLNGHLGGWTQTGVTLDESAKAVAKRDFYMLAGKCLVCGVARTTAALSFAALSKNAEGATTTMQYEWRRSDLAREWKTSPRSRRKQRTKFQRHLGARIHEFACSKKITLF